MSVEVAFSFGWDASVWASTQFRAYMRYLSYTEEKEFHLRRNDTAGSAIRNQIIVTSCGVMKNGAE